MYWNNHTTAVSTATISITTFPASPRYKALHNLIIFVCLISFCSLVSGEPLVANEHIASGESIASSKSIVSSAPIVSSKNKNTNKIHIEIPDVDLFYLNDSTRTAIENAVANSDTKKDKVTALHDYLFTHYGVNIRYRFDATATAQETFTQGEGNCLSLAVLFMAAARHLDLKPYAQKVEVPRSWEAGNEYFMVPGHVNVAVPLHYGDIATVEFLGSIINAKSLKSRRISEQRLLSEYYNNKGSDALSEKDYPLAIAYFKKATQTFRSAEAWSNLGVAAKMANDISLAEKAYKKSLRINSNNLSVISNLYSLYRTIGQDKKAQKYLKKVERYGRKHPERLIKIAELDIQSGDYEQAIEFSQKALTYAPDNAHYHHTLAIAYYHSGKMDLAFQAMSDAQRVAQIPTEKSRYRNKMEFIQQLTEGGKTL